MNSKKKRIIISLFTVVIALVVLSVAFFSSDSNLTPYQSLKKYGYSGSLENMMACLTSEHAEESDKTSYEIAVENGYKKDQRKFLLTFIENSNCKIIPEEKSSYEMAVENGFTGTEKAWYKTLQSINTFEYKTAYDLAVENGFEKSPSIWMDCLKGKMESDKTIFDIARKNGYKGSEAELVVDLAIATGAYGIGEKTVYDLASYAGYDGSFPEWLAYIVKDDNLSDASGYQIALENGYKGTVEDWIYYLIYKPNDSDSPYNEIQKQGFSKSPYDFLCILLDNNESCYEIVKKSGYGGTESEWISILTGNKYKTPYEQAVQHGYKGTEKDFYKDVVSKYNRESISTGSNIDEILNNVNLNEDSHLVIELNDSITIDLGEIETEGEKPSKICVVTFISYDDTYIDSVLVKKGKSVKPPPAPKRQGYVFTKWDKPLKKITNDLEVKPEYKKTSNCTIQVEQKVVNTNTESVSVAVSVDNNPGIIGSIITLEYDSDALILKSVKNGSAFNDALTFTQPKELISGCHFMWDCVEISDEQIKNGDILIMNFEIKQSAKRGKHKIELSYNDGDIVDNELNLVSPEIINGYVEIKQ